MRNELGSSGRDEMSCSSNLWGPLVSQEEEVGTEMWVFIQMIKFSSKLGWAAEQHMQRRNFLNSKPWSAIHPWVQLGQHHHVSQDLIWREK